jgi:aldehyde dehydrogenase (NAD+)
MANVAEIFETMDYGPAPEAADAVRAWLAPKSGPLGFFIGGLWTQSKSGKEGIVSQNPATGEELATLSVAVKGDVDAAVESAAAAFPAWSKTSDHARARVLYALARLIQKNSRFIAVLETLDNGKPIRETRDIDIPLAARHFYYHAGWAQLMESELPDYEPLGVVGQIIPWNFPFLMLAWKVAPAIAAGNCVVLKPAEFTSLTALYFAELCEEAGVPPGVVNIVTGAGETGALIVDHPGIAKIAFTGSTEVGRAIREKTAGSGKKLTLELGGKSAFIVCDDADLDAAVEGLVDAIWFNQGQVCCAGSRLLVEEGVSEKFIGKIKRRLETFRIGDPLDKCIDMGAIVDPVQHRRIDSLVRQSVSEGATLWQPTVACPDKGCFYLPTLLTDVSPANVAMTEEIFGPVLAATTFRTTSEAIALANNSRYGLSATVWSQNLGRAVAISNELKAGVVWVNTTNQFDAASGFGGYRESGFGREGGLEGFYEYLKPKDEWLKSGDVVIAQPAEPKDKQASDAIDRSPKHFIGGKQVRPDNGATLPVLSHDCRVAGRIAHGSRKDIRDAVEAAVAAESWSKATAHNRAQILYYIAENLSVRVDEFAKRINGLTGVGPKKARGEVDASIARLFSYAAWADKFDGQVHSPPQRSLALALHEPIGILAIACPDPLPLLGFVSLVAPAIAMGNRTIVVPSSRYPLIATDFYQVLETSDVPGGVVNIVTGARDELAQVLAKHDQVEGLWYHGSAEGSAKVEALSAANLKRIWVNGGKARDWLSLTRGEGRQFLREACQVKNVWLPYGD